MRVRALRTKVLISFLCVIAFLGICISLVGLYVLNEYVLGDAQKQVRNSLTTVRTVYADELNAMKVPFAVINKDIDLDFLKDRLGMDYLRVVSRNDIDRSNSKIILKAVSSGKPTGAARIVEREDFGFWGINGANKEPLKIIDTPKARPTDKKDLTGVMVIEYARPFYDDKGDLIQVICGGKVINRNFEFIDRIRDTVFENEIYADKPLGTVTIFQNDVRVSTNVLDDAGNRAIGTRVSDRVYTKVIESGRRWIDRAFVVTDWYLTAYEPIVDVSGDVIGILYVGLLEEPFLAVRRNVLMAYFTLILAACVLAISLSYMFSRSISRPIGDIVKATKRIAEGNWESVGHITSNIEEVNDLVESYEEMAGKLADRERKLEALNKSHLDLIGFVSHELKGILASAILNVHSVQGGFLGMTNFKQRKVLDSVAKNLDYLSATVKNFLNLSRIQKGEVPFNKTEVKLREDIVNETVDDFEKQANTKEIELLNEVDPEIKVSGDPDLLKIILNNLVGNAIKYGISGGKVEISALRRDKDVLVRVYNDSIPLTGEDIGKLFKKFSRIKKEETKREKGTGLGLFITRELVERHGGKITARAEEKGNVFEFNIITTDTVETSKEV